MNSISFVDRLTLDFKGNVAQNALCLGDVDNDGEYELSVGNSLGQLAIYKGTTKPWKYCKDLGHISAVACGDLLNLGRNILVVVSVDGFCQVFDFHVEWDGGESNQTAEVAEDEDAFSAPRLFPSYRQRIPANVKEIFIADVNGDGFSELVVTLTDRVVRIYQWHHTGDLLSHKVQGELVPLNKWEFASQVGGCALNRESDGSTVLLVAQQEGPFLKVPLGDKSKCVEYEALPDIRVDQDVSSEIIGQLSNSNQGSSEAFAVATLNGALMLVKEERVVWSIKFDQQLLGLRKLDVNSDGKDEILVSSWEGQTFIVTQDCHTYAFFFDESVSTFTCGLYTIEEEKTVPVLVFVTFTNKIYVYYDIQLTKGGEVQLLPSFAKSVSRDEAGSITDFLLYGQQR